MFLSLSVVVVSVKISPIKMTWLFLRDLIDNQQQDYNQPDRYCVRSFINKIVIKTIRLLCFDKVSIKQSIHLLKTTLEIKHTIVWTENRGSDIGHDPHKDQCSNHKAWLLCALLVEVKHSVRYTLTHLAWQARWALILTNFLNLTNKVCPLIENVEWVTCIFLSNTTIRAAWFFHLVGHECISFDE